MTDQKQITFSLDDQVLGSPLSPENTTLPLLSEFIQEVSTFLKGSKRLDLTKIQSSLSIGSIMITAYNDAGLLDSAISDYMYVKNNRSIDGIDPARAEVIESWQRAAIENEFRTYKLALDNLENTADSIIINKTTLYQVPNQIWVDVDKYLYGKVYDLGGKHQPNVHLGLENGATLTIEADSSFLSQDDENRLYKNQLVHIKAKQNIVTRQLKDQKLVSFEHYDPHFDQQEFDELVEKSTVAWKSVKDPNQWLEQLRGNDA